MVSVGSLDATRGGLLVLTIDHSDASISWVPDSQDPVPIVGSLGLVASEQPFIELELDALAVTVRASADGQGYQTLGGGAHPVPLQGSVLFVYATSFAPAEQLGEQVRVSTVEICPG